MEMNKITKAREDGLLTEMESNLVQYLLEKGYYAEKHYSDLTVRDIANNMDIPVESTRGVVGSLVRKGYLYVEEMEDSDIKGGIVYATDKCYRLDDDYENRWGSDY